MPSSGPSLLLPSCQAELSGYLKVGRSWQQCVAMIDPLTTPPLAVSKMCTSILRRDSYTPLCRFQVCFLISRFLFGWNCIPQASIGSLNVYLMPVTEMTRAKHWNTPKAWGQLTWFLKRLHFQLWDIKENLIALVPNSKSVLKNPRFYFFSFYVLSCVLKCNFIPSPMTTLPYTLSHTL